MQQYLLNLTCIWLLGLVLFDLLLRRERYHSYNRAYLLFTLLLGLILPLITWQHAEAVYPSILHRPVERIVVAKEIFSTAAITPTTIENTNSLSLLFIIWCGGATIALALLIVDILKLAKYSRGATRPEEFGWTIIETGRQHAPFSFGHSLYVGNKQQYTDEEWQMICQHEMAHTRALHTADLLLLHFLRILFWFHPLVYIYYHRLLMVHEYQADDIAAEHPARYGSFLVEQSLLHAAPTITHSFHRSPIKSRLRMLSRTSHKASKVKLLIFIPLTVVCIGCFSKKDDAIRPEIGRPVVSEMPQPSEEDKNEMTRQMALMNKTETHFQDWFIDALAPLLEKLDDGMYQIGPPFAHINKHGKFSPSGLFHIARVDSLSPVTTDGKIEESGLIDDALRRAIDARIADLAVNCPLFDTLCVNGEARSYEIRGLYVTIHDHHILSSSADL